MMMSLTACSTGYYDGGYQQPSYSQHTRSIPSIPEVTRPVQARARIPAPRKSPIRPKVVTRTVVPQRTSSATIRKYSVQKSKPADVVITQKDIAAVNEALIREEKKQTAAVEIDPYASIPDHSTAVVTTYGKNTPAPAVKSSSSPALKALLIKAQADLVVGNTSSAISKLERGLRIEPNNSKLWGILARAHFEQADYLNTINMAKKAIRYSNNDNSIAKNWALIKKAGLESGDTTVVKEAINYSILNP